MSNPVTVSIPVHEIVAGYIPYSVEEITADNGSSDESLNSPTGEAYAGKLPIRLNSTARIDGLFALVVYYGNGNSYGNVFSRLTALPSPRIDISTIEFEGALDDTTEGYVVNDDSAHLELDSIDHIATGIENVGVETETDAEYYDLQGRVVANPGPGVYIRRTGATVQKIIIR